MELMTDSRDDLLAYPDGGPSFDVVRKGYDREQVHETLAGLDADLRVALADRDAAVARSADLARQLQALHGEVEQLRRRAASAGAPTFENMGERISNMLRLAEEEAAEIRRAAEQQAAQRQAAGAARAQGGGRPGRRRCGSGWRVRSGGSASGPPPAGRRPSGWWARPVSTPNRWPSR